MGQLGSLPASNGTHAFQMFSYQIIKYKYTYILFQARILKEDLAKADHMASIQSIGSQIKKKRSKHVGQCGAKLNCIIL